MNQDTLHMMEASHSTGTTTDQNDPGPGVTLCVRPGSIPVCHILPDPVYLIASINKENTSEQTWLFNLDNPSQNAFKAWQKEHSPPDLISYFNHGQTWWRGQIEITVDFSRNILSSESELPANLNVNNWLRLLTRITQINDQIILDLGNAQEQQPYSEYEFRQFLALFFEWFLERYASYNFRPYIPSRTTELPVPVLQAGKNKGKKKAPRTASPQKKSDECSEGSKESSPQIVKPMQIASTCPTREYGSDDDLMTPVDQAIKNKKYDQAITRLLKGYGNHRVLKTPDDLKLQSFQARMGQAVQGKLDRISETHLNKPSPSMAQLETAFSQVSSLKLIPEELLSKSILSRVNRQISDIGKQAEVLEFEHLDLTPETLQQNTEHLYHLYRPILNARRLKFIGKHWLDATGIRQQAEHYLSLSKPIDAMRLLAQQPLMFNEFVPKQDQQDLDRIKAVYTRVVQESLSAMSEASANSHTDILLLEQLLRIHYRMNHTGSLLPHRSISSMNEQLESLIARQSSSESGQVITISFTPFASPGAESDTLTDSNFSDLTTQVTEMINSGNHAGALGLTFALMNHPDCEQAVMTTLSEILKLLITPVVYDLSNKISQPNGVTDRQQRAKVLYEATYHLRYYLNAELITRISWLHAQLPEPIRLTLSQPDPIVEPKIEKPVEEPEETESTTDVAPDDFNDTGFILVTGNKKGQKRKNYQKESAQIIHPSQNTKKEDDADKFFKRYPTSTNPQNPSERYLPHIPPATEAEPEPVTSEPSQTDPKNRPAPVKKAVKSHSIPWTLHRTTSEIAPATHLPGPTQMNPDKGEGKATAIRSDQDILITLRYLINLALKSNNGLTHPSTFEITMKAERLTGNYAQFLIELANGTISCSELNNGWLLSLDLKQLDDVIKKSLVVKQIRRY